MVASDERITCSLLQLVGRDSRSAEPSQEAGARADIDHPDIIGAVLVRAENPRVPASDPQLDQPRPVLVVDPRWGARALAETRGEPPSELFPVHAGIDLLTLVPARPEPRGSETR
jgi:hypothetical protein